MNHEKGLGLGLGPGKEADEGEGVGRRQPAIAAAVASGSGMPVAGVHEAEREQARLAAHAAAGPDGFAAGSPLIARRAFLAAGAAGLAACGWDGGQQFRPAIATASRLNDWISERLFSLSRLAPKYEPGDRSQNFPNYHISRMTPALADPAAWRLDVGGLVRTPLSLTLDEIRALGRVTYTVKHHCVEGWSAIATWTGTPLLAVAELAGVRPEARYVRFDSFDAGYFNGWDMKSALHPETILAWCFNDRELMPDHGAPLRLYAPHKLGYKLTKYLTTITFTADRPGGYWEDQGYPWFGGV